MSGFHWHRNEVLLVGGLIVVTIVVIAQRHRLGIGVIDFTLLTALGIMLLVAIGKGVI